MRSLRRSVRRQKERGNALVESGLVLVVFILTLVFIFDAGQVLFQHQSLSERVREALRYGSVNTYDATGIQNYVIYGQAVPAQGAQPYFSLTPQMVSVQRLDAGTADDTIVVTLSNYPYQFISPFIAGNRSGAPITECLPYEGP